MSYHVREDAELAAAAAKRLSDALRADEATAAKLDSIIAEGRKRPAPEAPDDFSKLDDLR